MKAVSQPLHEPRLGIGQVDARHTDLGESQFLSQRPQPGYELHRVDHFEPIVETRHWADEQDTADFARRLSAAPALRDAFIALDGELGAGKTTFVRHLLRALGIAGRIKSPTYAVVEPYQAPDGLAIHHFDFFRFNDPREWDDAGFRDIFAAPGLQLAEWPKNVAGRIPVADLAIKIEATSQDTRTVTLTASTPRGARLLAACAP